MSSKIISLVFAGIILLVIICLVVYVIKSITNKYKETNFQLPDLDKENENKVKFKSSVSSKIPKTEDKINENLSNDEIKDSLTLEEANKINNTSIVHCVKLPEIEKNTENEEAEPVIINKAVDDFDKMIEAINDENK